jgi:vancomycin permeability regulator SanA
LNQGYKKSTTLKKLLLLELILFELFVFAVMETYKYYLNFEPGNFLSSTFLNYFIKNFDITYIGNLMWPAAMIVSLISSGNIYKNINYVKESVLKILLVLSIFLLILLVIAVFIPSTDFIDDYSSKVIQLNTRGTKTIMLAVFASLKLFMTISLAVISFSALKKFYVIRSIWITILVSLIIFAALLIWINLYKDDRVYIESSKLKLDAGVVLGAAVWGGNRPSPVLRERINKGYELLKEGTIKYIVLTGGGSPGEMTEAEVAKNEFLKKGIDEKNIFAENKSNSTLEQITYVNRNLYKKYNWQGIILITDNFHLPRSEQICRFYGISAYGVASDTPLSTESSFYYSVKESFAIILFWLFGIG